MDVKEILESLPSKEKAACEDCGATDWNRCNISDETGGFFQCDKCHTWNEQKQILERNCNA